MKYRKQKQLRCYTLKWNNLKVYISLKGNKLACFTNSYGSSQKLPLCELLVFIDMNTYILTEDRITEF